MLHNFNLKSFVKSYLLLDFFFFCYDEFNKYIIIIIDIDKVIIFFKDKFHRFHTKYVLFIKYF